MYSIWAPLLAAGVASAAQRPEITLPPTLNLPIINVANAGACSTAAERVVACYSDFGGEDDLLNADVDELLACACCDGSNNLASAYSACSTYMVEELSSTLEADAYGTIYPLCSMQDVCSGSGGSTTSSSNDDEEETGSAEPTATATGSGEIDPSATNSELPELTSETQLDVPTACESMFAAYNSCIRKTPGFDEMPYIEQAPCYCCATEDSSTFWTDGLDEYASTCSDWAETADPETYFPVASTFANFCKNFSDACEATATSEPTSEPTEDEEDDNNDDDNDNSNTETEETGGSTVTEEDPAEETGAGAILRFTAVSAIATFLALLIVW